MSDNILDISVRNAALKILIIIVVILTFMYGSYYILKLCNDYSKSKGSSGSETSASKESQIIQEYPVMQEIQEYPVMQEIQEYPVMQKTEETLPTKNLIKTIYKKYEDINKPSSYDSETGGYISEHDVCFLHKSGERDYTSKRPKCMACQVDSSNNGKTKHNNTNTNIIKSCPYSFDGSNNTNTKDKCIEICGKYKDS